MRLLVALALVGICMAPTLGWANEGEYAGMHTISVVSAFGNQFFSQPRRSGANPPDEVDLTWDVDAFIAERIADLLKDHFSIMPNSAGPNVFTDNTRYGRLGQDEIAKVTSVPGPRADLFIVVYPSGNPLGDLFGDPKISLFGLAPERNIFTKAKTTFSLLFFIAMIDGKSLKRIDTATPHYPSADCERDIKPSTDRSFDAEQVAFMKPVFSDLLDYNLARSLQAADILSESAASAEMKRISSSLAVLGCAINEPF